MKHIIEKGMIFKKLDFNKRKKVNYIMRELYINDIDEVLDLQKKVYQTIKNKKLYQMRKREEFEKYLLNGGIFLGVFVNDELIAARITDSPGLNKDNYGYLLEYSKEKLKTSIHFKIMLVLPCYRGNHLQLRTMKIVEKLFLQKGFIYGLCRISPYNYYSIYNALKFGLKIKKIHIFDNKETYIRYILEKELEGLQPITFNNVKYVDNKNIEYQNELLEQGYIGFKAKNFNKINNFTIVYGKA